MKALIEFFQQVIKLLSTEAKTGFSEEEEVPVSDNSKDAYKWFLEQIKDLKSTRVQVNKDPWLKPGKIYIFKYDAKYKNVLDYWDQHPIVFALGKMETSGGSLVNLGLNISWYPPAFRKQIVERIRKMYEPKYSKAIKNKSQLANDQEPVYVDLYALKIALDQMGLSFAMRTYLPDRIKSPKVCVCYEDWDKAIRLDQPKVFPELKGKTSLFKVYDEFKKHVLNYQSRKGEYLKRANEAKKLNKYRFIK
jgi:hypothetical protein